MTHSHIRTQRKFKRATFVAFAPLLTTIAAGAGAPASAGEVDRAGDPAAVVRQAQCNGSGSETPLMDSGGCLRIRGYIAADAPIGPDQPIGERRAPFGPLDAPGIVASVRASGETSDKAVPNPYRFFMPASRGDIAR